MKGRRKERAPMSGLIKTGIWEGSRMISLKDMVSSYGMMVGNIKDNGRKIR